MKTPHLSRRGFTFGAIRAAAVVAAEAILRSRGRAEPPMSRRAPPLKSAGMRLTLDSLGLSDRRLRYMKQVGIDDVELNTMHIPGYGPRNWLSADQVRAIRKKVESHGMRLGSVYLDQSTLQNFLLGRPGGEEELDNVCRTIESLGQAGVPLFLFSLLASRAVLTATHGTLPGYHLEPIGRGGSRLRLWDASLAEGHEPLGQVSLDDTWARLQRFLERCVPVAEESNVVLGCHPADPPVPRYFGVNQAEYTFDALKRYIDLVPSRCNQLLFCQGTIQQAGIDVLEYIRYFGSRGKIAQAEFRGVKGVVPHYVETFMDEGDLSLWTVIKALKAVHFSGPIEVAHVPSLDDDSDERIIDAWSVGYVKGMLAAAADLPG